ncbi:hypothetical protein GJ496_008909 [Pomphorhynchus laevis]|nr:hypothetical protein GJ496_008909 [Pomphorhynchus laevis]
MYQHTCQWQPNSLTLPVCSASHKFVEILAGIYAECAHSRQGSIDSIKSQSPEETLSHDSIVEGKQVKQILMELQTMLRYLTRKH